MQENLEVEGALETECLTLDQFISQMHTKLIVFEAYWREHNKVCPEDFPMQLWAGDWDEQLDSFCDEDQG